MAESVKLGQEIPVQLAVQGIQWKYPLCEEKFARSDPARYEPELTSSTIFVFFNKNNIFTVLVTLTMS